MLEHLDKVVKMCHDMDYYPMMWSDMFFRMVIPNGGYYSPDVEIPQNIIDLVPKGLTIIYWDYYKKTPEYFVHMVESHLKFTEIAQDSPKYPYICHNLWQPNAVVGVM